MSGSPKYSVIAYNALAVQRAARARERREQARREQEQRRQARERDRVERLTAAGRESTRAALGPARDLAAELRRNAGAGFDTRLRTLEERISTLTAAVGTSTLAEQSEIVRAAHQVRGDLAGLRVQMAVAAGVAMRSEVVRTLRAALDGAVANADADAEAEAGKHIGKAREELDRLQETVSDTDGFAFDVRRGTAEAAVNRAVHTAAEAVERQRTEQRERAEAEARLAVLTERVETAVSDAAGFAADDLGEPLRTALAAAREAVRTGPAGSAAPLLDHAERRTAEAEARLDELAVAAEQRVALADVLKTAMARQGLLYIKGEDHGSTLTMNFQRPNGAVYRTRIEDSGPGGEGAVLTYSITGEPDVAEDAEITVAADRVCDETAALLGRVHGDLPEEYRAGPLFWSGQPKPRDPGPEGRERAKPIDQGADRSEAHRRERRR
ncbi:hypothetical protein [Catenulispora subtropica]|uniref:Uncharacterized protein n=1 Tax=Catenulispora subtropica TaxID=450798 RepID=A0ABN2R034_9ACTN